MKSTNKELSSKNNACRYATQETRSWRNSYVVRRNSADRREVFCG